MNQTTRVLSICSWFITCYAVWVKYLRDNHFECNRLLDIWPINSIVVLRIYKFTNVPY